MAQRPRETMDHDACGIGAVVNIDGRRTHAAVNDALTIVEHLGHRAGKDASGEVGDGVGILLQISFSARRLRLKESACLQKVNTASACSFSMAIRSHR